MNITDQLAQALEELLEPMRRYEQDSDTWPYKEEVSRAAEALSAYRASKEGEWRMLEDGETIRLGDQYKTDDGWCYHQTSAGCGCIGHTYRAGDYCLTRRPIRATWQHETAQRLADSYKAASESGNLPDVP